MLLVGGWWIPVSTFSFHFHLSPSQIEFFRTAKILQMMVSVWWGGGGSARRGIKCPTPWGLNWCHYHMNSTKTKNSVRLWVTFPHSQQSWRLAAAWFMLSVCHNCSAITGIKAVCSHKEACRFVYPGNRLLLSDKWREAETRYLSTDSTSLCCNAVMCARDRPSFSANGCLRAGLY